MHVDCKDLRVLLVGTYPPPFGGIATHLISLVPGLKERGAADIAIVSIGADEGIQQIEGAVVYRFNIKNHVRTVFDPANWGIVLHCLRSFIGSGLDKQAIVRETVKAVLVNDIAKKHNSEVVNFYHSNAHLELVPLAAYWGKKRGVNLCIFGEVYGSPEFFKSIPSLARKELETPAVVWASSDHCANSFKQLGIDRFVRTVYYGVELEHTNTDTSRTEFREKNAIASGDRVFLFMGRFIKDMGLDVILEIIPTLLAENQNVKFVLAGAKGDLSGDAEKLAQGHPGKIMIFQNFPFSMQQSLFCGCDIILAPSYDQRACMGLSIKEAMSFHRPVIATDCGGIPEAIVHSETGYLVPLDPDTKSADIPKLTTSMRRLMNDPALCEKFGATGYQRAVDLFSVESTINKVTQLLMDARPSKITG